ncbi:MAG: hypothetical protein FAF04_08175 [Epsilonproteobacteria bacterium]|nr:hypothetical protein [Campylobacterota bacterium]
MSRTGMRPGELLACKWSDVLFDEEIIKVRRTRIQGKNGPPKKRRLFVTLRCYQV